MPSIGSLDRRITIERFIEAGRNAFNEPVASWTSVGSFWGRRRDLSDGERQASGTIDSFLVSRFVVRSNGVTRTVTPVFRVVYDGSIWNIQGVKETSEGRSRFIEITAVRDADGN
ncbi:head-tail adaptor protein [Rhizobium leguminosarum]|uniref:head-tail adaptor protein n=1 Tax=Rhizobium leguminosarum TaxID=384 RepID=UPI003D087AE9